MKKITIAYLDGRVVRLEGNWDLLMTYANKVGIPDDDGATIVAVTISYR